MSLSSRPSRRRSDTFLSMLPPVEMRRITSSAWSAWPRTVSSCTFAFLLCFSCSSSYAHLLHLMISSLFAVTESPKNDRAMSAMARELRQLVDTANAPIFGIDVDVSSLAAVISVGISNAAHSISFFTHNLVYAHTFSFRAMSMNGTTRPLRLLASRKRKHLTFLW